MISLQYDLSLEIKCSRRSMICTNLCKILLYYVLCNKHPIVYHYEYQIFFKSVVSFDFEGYDFITKPLLNTLTATCTTGGTFHYFLKKLN